MKIRIANACLVSLDRLAFSFENYMLISSFTYYITLSGQNHIFYRKKFATNYDKLRLDFYCMSRVGRYIDNGPMEGFWDILKCEMYYLGNFKVYDSLVAAIKATYISTITNAGKGD
jgi:hypothetical protein